ncbi:MAG TPA: hypothetical protein VIX38_01945 [Nitrososphaeraceae archaeon]
MIESPTPTEVTIRLKHRDWEIEVSCIETKIREVMKDVLTSIDDVSRVDPTLDIQINELKKEIDLLKASSNVTLTSNMSSGDIHSKRLQKGGATCRGLLEKLLLEGYFETEKLLGNVHAELSRRGYNYDRTAVSHSLKDMVRESILTRVGSLRNYRYLQKRPISET